MFTICICVYIYIYIYIYMYASTMYADKLYLSAYIVLLTYKVLNL